MLCHQCAPCVDTHAQVSEHDQNSSHSYRSNNLGVYTAKRSGDGLPWGLEAPTRVAQWPPPGAEAGGGAGGVSQSRQRRCSPGVQQANAYRTWRRAHCTLIPRLISLSEIKKSPLWSKLRACGNDATPHARATSTKGVVSLSQTKMYRSILIHFDSVHTSMCQ